MRFLKKIGLAILRGVGVVAQYAPYALAQIPPNTGIQAFDLSLGIGNIIIEIEAAIGAISAPDAKSGEQKLAAATPLVAQVILRSALMAGSKFDRELFMQGCRKITSGFADVVNSRED